MPQKQLVQARIDKTVKEEAAAVLAAVGLTVSGALRRASSRSLAAVALIAPLGVCSPAGDHGTAPATVRDSLGVVIVESTGRDRPLEETPVRFGVLTHPDRTLDFVPWGIAADPIAGFIYVADQSEATVVVFDSLGAYSGDIGRRGGGPG